MASNDGKTPVSKIAAFIFIATAIVWLVSAILHHFGVGLTVVNWIARICTLLLFCFTAFAGWHWVRTKDMGWKLLYLVCVAIVVVAFVLGGI